jgi:hypothetical protein
MAQRATGDAAGLLAGLEEQRGNLSAAIDALQQVVAIDPLHEPPRR